VGAAEIVATAVIAAIVGKQAPLVRVSRASLRQGPVLPFRESLTVGLSEREDSRRGTTEIFEREPCGDRQVSARLSKHRLN